MRTGIAPDVWERQDERTLITAFDLLKEEHRSDRIVDGMQMSG